MLFLVVLLLISVILGLLLLLLLVLPSLFSCWPAFLFWLLFSIPYCLRCCSSLVLFVGVGVVGVVCLCLFVFVGVAAQALWMLKFEQTQGLIFRLLFPFC